MRQIAVAAFVALGLALALSAPAGAIVDGLPAYGAARVASADDGEIAVVWSALTAGQPVIQAAIGTPGTAFGAPVAIAPPATSTNLPEVAMDAAGDVVIVWEAVHYGNCSKGVCQNQDSLGTFASVRPAGGTFRAPLRLSPARPGQFASPLLAMNRRGDWVVVMREGSDATVVAATGASAPSAPATIPAPGFTVTGVALDGAGAATLSGPDGAQHPAAIVRDAGGSFGPLTELDDASIAASGVAVGVGPRGDAVAVWPGGGFLRSATRLPGAGFAAPVVSGVAGTTAPESIGVDGQGRTIMVLRPAPVYPGRFLLQAIHGTVSAPFGDPVTLTAADRDVGGPTQFAMAADGDAALGWLETDRFSNPVAQAALATGAGPFAAPLALTRGAAGTVDAPAVAVDGTGRTALAWTSISGDVQGVVAAVVSPSGVAGPTGIAQASLIDPHPQNRASASPRQVLRIRRDGTIHPLLRCASLGSTCNGSVQIDVPASRGHKRMHVGASRFLLRSGSSHRVSVRVSRAARRVAARRSLRCAIVVRTAKSSGGSIVDAGSLTVRRRVG